MISQSDGEKLNFLCIIIVSLYNKFEQYLSAYMYNIYKIINDNNNVAFYAINGIYIIMIEGWQQVKSDNY